MVDSRSDGPRSDTVRSDGLGGTTVLPALGGGFIRQAKIGTEIAGHLRDLVISGYVRPGQRLRLQEVADSLGVSTTPVREALLILEKEGLVESEQHRGFSVKGLTARDVLDIYELHAFLAALLVERATPHLTDDDFERLAELDRRIRDAVDERRADEVERQNFEFHRLINRRAPDSALLHRFLRETTRYVPRRYYTEIPGWLHLSAQDHRGILRALQRRDGRAAASETAAHIKRAGSLLVDHLHDAGIWFQEAGTGDGPTRSP